MIDGGFVCIFWGVLMMHGDVLDTAPLTFVLDIPQSRMQVLCLPTNGTCLHLDLRLPSDLDTDSFKWLLKSSIISRYGAFT